MQHPEGLHHGIRRPGLLLLWHLIGLWVLGWGGILASSNAQASILVLRKAHMSTSVDGFPGQTETDINPAMRAVTLPIHWDREYPNRTGRATFELAFSLAHAPPAEPYAMYFPAVGNTAEIWINGKLLTRLGNIQKTSHHDYAKTPHYLNIPPSVLQRDNLMQVHIRADANRRAGLAQVLVGPASELEAYSSALYAWRIKGSTLLGLFSLLVAFIALAFWIIESHRTPDGHIQRNNTYLWAGIAELCWAFRVSDALIAEPPLPWPYWGMLSHLSYAGWICGMLLFCHHVADWHRHRGMVWVRTAVACLFLVAIPASWLGTAGPWPVFLTLWYGIAGLVSTLYIGIHGILTLRAPSLPRTLILAMGVLNIAAGLRDWVIFRLSDSFGSISWSRYVSLFFGLSLLTLIVVRFRQASCQARELLGTLETRIAEREEELAGAYRQLEAVAREQARANERERILRDMHDGVGSHISTAIRQLGSGQANPQELLRTLRDSLDQLKLSIDSIHMPPGDVGALLAGLRYRLEPRLKAAGIRLEWVVEELACIERLDSQGMRQLQFLLFEAISNVLQHAHAATLRIEACMHLATVRLRIIDDGCGFDPQQVPRMLRERASALGVQLTIESQPGRTVVEVLFAPSSNNTPTHGTNSPRPALVNMPV